MNSEQMMLCFLLLTGVVLVIILFKSKVEFFINMVLRMMMGTIGVCVVNSIFLAQGMETGIGINLITLGLLGFLGLPGFLLLYGMAFYQLI